MSASRYALWASQIQVYGITVWLYYLRSFKEAIRVVGAKLYEEWSIYLRVPIEVCIFRIETLGVLRISWLCLNAIEYYVSKGFSKDIGNLRFLWLSTAFSEPLTESEWRLKWLEVRGTVLRRFCEELGVEHR